MENPTLDALTIVSETESADDLKRETAQDALIIVLAVGQNYLSTP
jgi:hypothetical protein